MTIASAAPHDILTLGYVGDRRLVRASRRAIQTENFLVLSPFLPRGLRADFRAVYDFCRGADDVADDPRVSPAERLAALGEWKGELHRGAAGDSGNPVIAALKGTIARHRVPLRAFDDLLDAFEQDQRVFAYRTWTELRAYAMKSAAPVGRVVLMMAGHRPPEEDGQNAEMFRLSDEVCIGLQVVNFLQDVPGDLVERGRVYVPRLETGLTAELLSEWIARPDASRGYAMWAAIRPLAGRARALLGAGDRLCGLVSPEIARVVELFVEGGRAALGEIERLGPRLLMERASVGRAARARALVRVMMRPVGGGRDG